MWDIALLLSKLSEVCRKRFCDIFKRLALKFFSLGGHVSPPSFRILSSAENEPFWYHVVHLASSFPLQIVIFPKERLTQTERDSFFSLDLVAKNKYFVFFFFFRNTQSTERR